MWKVLNDGKAHDTKSLASAVGYTNKQSQGFRDTINDLTKLDLVDTKKSTIQLRGFLFPLDSNGSRSATGETFAYAQEISFDEERLLLDNVVSI